MVTEIKKNWFRRHWIISTLVFVFFILPILSVVLTNFSTEYSLEEASEINQEYQESSQEIKTQQIENIMSNSFSDYGDVYCDVGATDLQKEELFDTKFKDKYIKWTGEVSSVSESWGSYNLQVKHCSNTFSSDIVIIMEENQKEELLTLREGDMVTYTARLKRFGSILGLSADDGKIII